MPRRARDGPDQGGPNRRRRRRQEPSSPAHADASGSSEEEPEGDDLFGEDYYRDYIAPDSDDDDGEDVASFIDSASEISEVSDRGMARVGAMLERRHRVERAVASRNRVDVNAASIDGSSVDTSLEGSLDDEPQVDAGEGSRDNRRDTSSAFTVADPNDPHNVFIDNELPDSATFDWTRPHGELTDWLSQEATARVVRNRAFNFFLNFTVNDVALYVERVKVMARRNEQSLEIAYIHLASVYNSVLALWLINIPERILEILDEAANFLVYNMLFPHYHSVHKSVRVRIADLPLIEPIRGFRQVHRNVLVQVQGVVTRRSPVYPQLQAVRYDCQRCSYVIGPVMQRSDREVRVSQCPSCQSKGPFRVNMALTEYRNHQTLIVQEPPGQVPPGRLPRSLEVILTHDLIDRARPGETVSIVGTYKNSFDALLNSRQGFPVFTTVLVANNVTCTSTDVGSFSLPDDERRKMVALSRHPRIKAKLIASMAPSIHGREDIKLGLLLALLGGVPKDIGNDQSHRIRGDINVLLVGDPGTAKSQCLKFVEKVADRAVFTTGRGSTAVGLTASVSKDAITGEFALEGGALVIADRGVCLIDEFDKMSDVDRTSIHEAMEQQTISVARGGIVTTLSARCSIIAAANPIGGRYDPSVGFDANVNLTTPILSRFDLLFVIRDEVNSEEDVRLAHFICTSHRRSHPASHAEFRRRAQATQALVADLEHRQALLTERRRSARSDEERRDLDTQLSEVQAAAEHAAHEPGVREDEDPASRNPLPQSTLKRYILFAKSQCRPMISRIDPDTLARVYTDLRQESKRGGIPITVRHMESIIRLSEAHARIFLRDFVSSEDVNAAIALFLRCFLSTQKYRLRQELEAEFRKFLDADVEPVHLLHHRLRHLVNQARAWEQRMTGVDPVSVELEAQEFEAPVLAMNIPRDALDAYYRSPEFDAEFELVGAATVGDARRGGGTIKIRHTLVV